LRGKLCLIQNLQEGLDLIDGAIDFLAAHNTDISL